MRRLPQGSGTILVADDDSEVRNLASRILKFAGYVALLAEDAPATAEALRCNEEVRLVLLDLTMPGGSCQQTVASLREIRSEVPILVMTGHPERVTRARLGGQEVEGLLEKPFQPPELIGRIRRILGEDD